MKRVLSLAGGGYLGLFTARFLELLEAQSGPIGSRFDLIAGTSVGGLIALALAAGRTAKEVRGEIEGGGSKIFPSEQSAADRLFKAGHDTGPLAAVVDRLLGKKTLGDLKVRVIVPTFCLTAGKVRIFRTPHLPQSIGDRHFLLRDIALATSAAPTYYKPHKIGVDEFADGGLAANAPDAIAATDTVSMRWPRADVRMLAVGTTSRSTALAASKWRPWGLASWLKGGKLRSALMAAQMDLARQTAETLLGSQATIVADPQLGTEQSNVLNLDKVTKTSKDTLLSIADTEFRRVEFAHPNEFAAIRGHVPQEPFYFS